jgi:opacity protein-like surface antigen
MALEAAEFDTTRTGYTLGGGLEVKVSKKWSVKGEYLFADFGRETITSNDLTTDEEIINNLAPTAPAALIAYPENTFTRSANLKTHSFRFGVNYRF